MSTIYAAQPPEKMREMPKQTLSLALLGLTALIAAAYLPLVMVHAEQLWIRPHYQFFPLVVMGAAVLAWSRGKDLQRLDVGSLPITIALVGTAWLGLASAEIVHSSWLAAVATQIFLLAAIYGLGGGSLVRRMLPAWIFLWLIVPPPFGLDYLLILRLQTLTTRWSSALLDMAGIYHGITGHVITIGGQQLFVEEARAGVNSLFSILACGIFYVFYTRMPALRGVLIILASLVWVLLANVARVFLVAYMLKRWDVNLAVGWRHDALGFALFGVAVGMIWSSNRLILMMTPFLGRRQAAPVLPTAVDEEQKPNWVAAWRRSWLTSGFAAGAFGLLLVGHLCLYEMTPALAAGAGEIAVQVQSLNEESLPRDIGGWRRDGKMREETRTVSNAFGQHSKLWVYRGPAQNAVVSLDYPFASWHELTECYYSQGWQIDESANVVAEGSKGPSHFCEHKMKKNGSRYGYLLFCQFDAAGQILTPRDRDTMRASLGRQESALRRLLAWNDQPDERVKQVGSVYQFQMFVETYAPMPANEVGPTKDRFFTAYDALHQNFATSK